MGELAGFMELGERPVMCHPHRAGLLAEGRCDLGGVQATEHFQEHDRLLLLGEVPGQPGPNLSRGHRGQDFCFDRKPGGLFR